MFFNKLNYTFTNEDNELESKILKEKSKNIFVIAGSGARALSLFSKNPKKVSIVDISQEQLFLTELKIESLRQLSYSDYLFFWDYFNNENNNKKRKKIFYSLKLSFKAFQYFEIIFNKNNWLSILYFGEWERKFIKISKINNFITGKKALDIFLIDDADEYNDFLKNKFPWNRFLLSLFILGNKKYFDSLLYKGKFPENNTGKSYFIFYKNVFKGNFSRIMANKNFFMQFLFFGKVINKKSLPFEAQEDNFEKIKNGIKNSEIEYILNDFVLAIKDSKNVDFVSSSDVLSYYNKNKAKSFLQEISSNLSKNAIVVNRYYLNIPKDIDYNGFRKITNIYKKKIEYEKTGMYVIDIFENK